MLFIGVCGASGSGKTTLSHELVKALSNARCLVINQDAYYVDHPDMTMEERSRLNYDEPGIFDHDLLLHDFLQLQSGQSIQKRGYDFTTHRRCDQDEILDPPDVLILEGIHAFYDQRLLDHMYLKLYMNVEADICLLRRINRDFKERGRSIDSISEQYLATVKPMYDKYIRNYFNQADVIVMRGGKNTRIVVILAGYLRDALEGNNEKLLEV